MSTYTIHSLADARRVARMALDYVAILLRDGAVDLVVRRHKLTRSQAQNRTFHMLCADIAKSSAEWAGKRRTAAQWKTLLVSGHAVATREETEIVPGLEGEFLNIRESTASMSVARGASLIDYTMAWAAGHGIKVRDPEMLRLARESGCDMREAA